MNGRGAWLTVCKNVKLADKGECSSVNESPSEFLQLRFPELILRRALKWEAHLIRWLFANSERFLGLLFG